MEHRCPEHILHCQSWMCPRKSAGVLTEPDGTLDIIAGAHYCTQCGERNEEIFNKHIGVGSGWAFVPYSLDKES